MKNSVRLPAFAKVNLRLHVLGRRQDGYHELRTLFQSITLHDVLDLSKLRGRSIELEIDDPALPRDRENLVYRAIEAMRRELNYRGGIHARLTKQIPVARGLGGGSRDAASAIIGMLRLSGKKLPLARAVEIGSELGADVPFFLFGGRALGVNRGDELYPLPDIPKHSILVVAPRHIHVSTPEAFRWAKAPLLASVQSRQLTKSPDNSKLWKFCALCWSAQVGGLSNDFERPVFRRHPRLATLKRDLLRAGATEAMLAGSGSAVFGVFPSPALARRAAVGFPSDQTFVCETISRERYHRLVQTAL